MGIALPERSGLESLFIQYIQRGFTRNGDRNRVHRQSGGTRHRKGRIQHERPESEQNGERRGICDQIYQRKDRQEYNEIIPEKVLTGN